MSGSDDLELALLRLDDDSWDAFELAIMVEGESLAGGDPDLEQWEREIDATWGHD